MEIHTCKICGCTFNTQYTHAEYCGDQCRNEAKRRRDAARIRTGRRRRKKGNYPSISEIIKQAALMGVSYGGYVNMRRLGKV